MKDDDGLRLDENQIAFFIRKFRAAAGKDPERGKDVIEILECSLKTQIKDEDYETFEMARTICEILEPERLGGLVSLTCKGCNAILSREEVEKKIDTCFSCRIGPDKGSCW